MYLGYKPAISIPVETEFNTTEILSTLLIYDQVRHRFGDLTENCEVTQPRLAKNTPARAAGLEL